MEVTITGRVCLVSHRLGGISGVSLEGAKWCDAFRALGWRVTRAAGAFFDDEPGDVQLRGLWSEVPGEEPPPVDHDTIARLVNTHDLLVLDNAGSLWTAPEASLALQQHALDAGIPTIARHHDPPWHGAPLRSVPPDSVPLHHPQHLHVVINQITYREFAQRWPQLETLGALRLVYNRVDVQTLVCGDRDATRAQLGVTPQELLVVHPARAIVARKGVPRAVEFVLELDRLSPRPVRYWITDGSTISPEILKYPHVRAVRDAFARIPNLLRGQVPRQADLYAAADLVILPSTWEGWGLPVLEAAAAGVPVAAGPYDVLDEIRACGLVVHDPDNPAAILTALSDQDHLAGELRENRRVVSERFAINDLPQTLAELATKAAELG